MLKQLDYSLSLSTQGLKISHNKYAEGGKNYLYFYLSDSERQIWH